MKSINESRGSHFTCSPNLDICDLAHNRQNLPQKIYNLSVNPTIEKNTDIRL